MSMPSASTFKSVVETLCFEVLYLAFLAILLLCGMPVGVIYAGNNLTIYKVKCSHQGLKWARGRCNHGASLMMTVPNKSLNEATL